MEKDAELNELKDKIEQRRHELELEAGRSYASAVGTQQVKEISTIAQDVNKTLETKLNNKLADVIDSDEEVNKHLTEASKALAVRGAETLQNKVDTENIKARNDKAKATFALSESKWRAFGCKQLPEKQWQQRMIDFGSNIWFVIRYVVCLLFFAPFYFFADMIDSQKGALKTIMIIISWVLLLGVIASVILLILHFAGKF